VAFRNSDDLAVHKHESIQLWQIIPLLLAAILLTIGLSMFMSGIQHAVDVVQPIIVVFGGTLVALLITFPLGQLTHALQIALIRGIRGGNAPEEMARAMLKVCDVSRREGLLGVAEIRSSSAEVERVCHLIGDAAQESDIQHGLARSQASERMVHQMAVDIFAFTIVYAILIGALASIVRMVSTEEAVLTGVNVLPFVSGVSLAILTTMLVGRLRSIHMREMVVVDIAYRSASFILEDNNVQRLRSRLSQLVPAGLRK